MSTALIWFRQDLRLTDNPALHNAVIENENILPIYILDETSPWAIGGAQRWWLHHSLISLQEQFKKHGLELILKKGNPQKILLAICQEEKINRIYWNRCYEPAVIQRDVEIKKKLTARNIKVQSYNGSLLYEPWEITNKQGGYFKVFSYFWKTCCCCLKHEKILAMPKFKNKFNQKKIIKSEKLEAWNLLPSTPDWASGFHHLWQPGELGAQKKLKYFISDLLVDYSIKRDFPGHQATSGLSPHLHFGEVSPRQIVSVIKPIENHTIILSAQCEHFLRQLGWREFSYHLLYHFPDFPEENFQKKFNHFPWSDHKNLLSCWQKGQTGYPIVDAGMRELWQTGYMHNRVRMIVASFLTKDLFIDWRHGAKWFWDTLLDADLANNSISWQWVAGSGVDAAPYFRIFNPVLQGEKFDPQGKYVRHWIPELSKLPNKYIHQPWKAPQNILEAAGIALGKNYPNPIVNHDLARREALSIYSKLKDNNYFG